MTMNFAEAKLAAEAAASVIEVANGVVCCPMKKRTGLIVMIYGGVDDNAIAQADVKVAGMQKTTADAGMAQFVLEAGNYEVQVRLPAELSNLIAPADVSCAVTPGKCHIQWIRVRSAVTFRVQKMVAGAATEFAGVRLKLKDLAERDTVLLGGLALATFEIPDAKPEQQKTCEVVSLKLDGADDIYEVEE